MRVIFTGRSVVCLVAMPPNALDLGAFERAAGLQRPVTQVSNPQLAAADYDRLNLLVSPEGRTQLGLKPNASRDLVRRAAIELLRQVGVFTPRAIGFNGTGRIEIDSPGDDPIRPLLNMNVVSERLESPPTRAGVKLVYASDGARITVDVEPDMDDEGAWATSINRHYGWSGLQTYREPAVSWFVALNEELPRLVSRLVSPLTAEQEHAA